MGVAALDTHTKRLSLIRNGSFCVLVLSIVATFEKKHRVIVAPIFCDSSGFVRQRTRVTKVVLECRWGLRRGGGCSSQYDFCRSGLADSLFDRSGLRQIS